MVFADILSSHTRFAIAQCTLATLVVSIHRGFESMLGDRFDRACCALEDRRECLSLRGGHRAQEVVLVFFGLRLPARLHLFVKIGRAADSNSNANEVGRAQRLGYRTNSAVAGIATTLFDSEPSRFEIELVVQHDQMLRSNLEIAEQVGDAFAAEIVKSLWLHEDRRLFGEDRFSGDAFESAAVELDAFCFCDSIDRHESAVVPRARIFLAWISQPGYHPLNRSVRFGVRFFCA